MPLHPESIQFLNMLTATGMPPVAETPLRVLRAASRISAPPLPDTPTLFRITDHSADCSGRNLLLRVYEPSAHCLGVCLFFHGGGWVLNSVETHDELARRLAAASGWAVVSVDYSLAPEHPFPAAFDEAWDALLWSCEFARRHSWPERVAVSGDSAGANLAAGLALLARDRRLGSAPGPAMPNIPIIHKQVLFYPVTQTGLDLPSYHENATGYFLTRDDMAWFLKQYLAAEHYDSPYVAVLHHPNLANLPDALIYTAEFDPLRDEGEAYALALQAAGNTVEYKCFPGMVHGFVKRVETFTDGRKAIELAGSWLRG